MKTRNTSLAKLATERRNRKSSLLDTKSSLEIARIINSEDAKVAPAVKGALPQIGRAIDLIVAGLSRGGRLIYVGAGTSGRIAALDAAECPPTFDTDPEMVQFIMAGGVTALSAAVEANEDSRELGRREIARRKPGKNDVVVGIAASGRTPFTVAALEYAKKQGAKTIAVTCNRNSPLEKAADVAIVTEVGPEVVSGSTRMKAGTAQKMVLNMLSTGALTRLGYVYGNFMVNVRQKNEKLTERAINIVKAGVGVSREAAKTALKQAGTSAAVALVMLETGANRKKAEEALETAAGNVRRAIASCASGNA